MLMSRLVRVLDDTVLRLGAGELTQCSIHRPCEDRRAAAGRLMAVRDSADGQELRRGLASAYSVEKRHPAFQAVVPVVADVADAADDATHATQAVAPETDLQLWTLTYVSQAPRQPSREELQAILDVSRRNNERLDITGVLQTSGTTYSQTLEGPIEAVAQLFGRISIDRRHGDVTILRSAAITERRYAEWRMALDEL